MYRGSLSPRQRSHLARPEAYRSIRKALLHLAILLHDIGKGFEEDHSEVGARIAADVALRLQLLQRESETLVFLVLKHLMMPLQAFRRDISDPAFLVRFGRDVGSQEMLRMLYVLSAADIKGVGPETPGPAGKENSSVNFTKEPCRSSATRSRASNHRVAAVRQLVKQLRPGFLRSSYETHVGRLGQLDPRLPPRQLSQ